MSNGFNLSLDWLGTKDYFLIGCYPCVGRKLTNITPNLLDWSMQMNLRKVPSQSLEGNSYSLSLACPFFINASGLHWSYQGEGTEHLSRVTA
jgi:hypothetical protein